MNITTLLIRGINLVLLLMACSCCKENIEKSDIPKQGDVKPLWSLKLPMGTSPYIYNGGLIRPPLYNGSIIFHTTLISNNKIEDNRLCAVDINKKQVSWLYPSDTSTPYNYTFDSDGYIYQNLLVAKSTYSVFGSNPNIDIICFDMNTRETKWIKSYPTMSESHQVGVIGYDNVAYHVKGRKELYAIDLNTGKENLICSIVSQNSRDGFIRMRILRNSKGEPFIYFDKEVDKKLYYSIFNITENQFEEDVQLQRSWDDGLTHVGIIVDQTYYYSCGEIVCAMDLQSKSILWKITNEQFRGGQIQVVKGVLIKYSSSEYVAFDAKTGKVLYSNSQLGTYWVVPHGDYIYMNTRKEQINIIDILTGKILEVIICPEDKLSGDGFNGAVNATFIDDKMYVMSYSTVYCYPTYPWKN